MSDLIQFPDDPNDGWRIALETAGIGAWYWNLNTGEVILSETSRRLLGLSAASEHTTSGEFFSRLHPDDIPLARINETSIREGRIEKFSMEFRCRDDSGSYRWIHTRGKVTKGSSGASPDIVVVGSHVDIATKRDPDAVHSQAEIYFHSAFKHAAIGMALVAPDGAFIEANQSLCNILGYTRDELVQKTFQEITHPEDLDSDLQYLSDIVAGKMDHYNLEKRYIHSSGQSVFALLSVSIARNQDDSPNHFIAQVQDISEQKRNQQQAKEALHAAEASNRAKSNFLATMSHEIRTPMNAVIGYSELLRSTELDEEQELFVSQIATSSDLLLLLINDLLDFSKIEAGEIDLEFSAFALSDTLDQSIELLRSRAQEKDLSLTLDLSPDLPDLVMGDQHRFSQILLNLIGNAIKFTEAGKVTVSGSIIQNEFGLNLLQINVSDTGIGISEEHIETLFQPFRQADSSMTRRFGGTGLGLSISSRLAKAMGGKITIKSSLGHGSTFSVEIPLHIPKDGPIVEAPQGSDSATIPGTTAILLDSRDKERQSLTYLFRSLGLIVFESKNVSRTRTKLEKNTYDLLILGPNTVHPDDLSAELPDHPPALFINNSDFHAKAVPERALTIEEPISIPILLESIEKLLATSESSNDSDAGQSIRILIVEDNDTNSRLMKSLISKYGYEADIAESGHTAMEMIQKHRYDLIFMDLHIPGPSGTEIAKFIRENESGNRPPFSDQNPIRIYAVTAVSAESVEDDCIAAGMNGFLLKPVRASQIEEILQ
tara:strand:- start:12068 stop:14383 length:2316 start_codon:yes stop_codon:yes gene_type:complete